MTLFRRFTAEARQVVMAAQEHARELRHNYLGTEHILLALASQPSGAAGEVLSEAGVTPDRLRSRIAEIVGAGPFTEQDARALGAFGIDLDSVRSRVEESFGAGALDRPVVTGRRRRPFWRHGRQSCAHETSGDRIPFTPRAKKVMELSLREALRLGHDWIGPEHVLLGVIREGNGIAAELLAQLAGDITAVRARLLDRLGRAA